MDWISCKNKKLVKNISTDNNLINSLLETSSKKFKTQSMLPLNNTTASSKFILAYDSLRELLEALSISKGYKIYNHECYCAFLKEILKESKLGDDFNSLRKIRNSINYYGKNLSKDETNSLIGLIIKIINLIKKKYFQ
tara:strand:+ start:3992 stop:4405 length:414 start_codon:yes stop_codon:yes gene_type:complete